MGSLASRLPGGELLTLHEFAYEVLERLSHELPDATVTQPRLDLLVVSYAGKRPIEFNLQSSYRAYQKAPLSKDDVVKRLVRWIETSAATRQ